MIIKKLKIKIIIVINFLLNCFFIHFLTLCIYLKKFFFIINLTLKFYLKCFIFINDLKEIKSFIISF
jgi:hypothetical protein